MEWTEHELEIMSKELRCVIDTASVFMSTNNYRNIEQISQNYLLQYINPGDQPSELKLNLD